MVIDSENNDNNDLSSIILNSADLKFSFVNSLNISEEAKSKLSLNLRNVLLGSQDIYLTPLGKFKNPEETLADLDKLINLNRNILTDPLYDLEILNKEKYGPRSLAKPWSERKESMLNYFNNGESKIIEYDNIPSLNLRPISIKHAYDYLKNSTNSGLPYYKRKGIIKDKSLSNFNKEVGQFPCILFTRTQELGKTRNVWGYPISDTAREMQFYVPLLSYQRNLNWRSALIGPDFVDESVTKLMLNKSEEEKFLSIDFSAYDASVGNLLQKSCFNYIQRLFQSKHSTEISDLGLRFNSIPIVTPSGIIEGKHGIPSGATFTNEVDSIAQYLIAKSVDVCDNKMQIQGDDGAYVLTDSLKSKLLDQFRGFGLVVNESKSYYNDTHIVYLQKLYDRSYMKNGLIGGIYPLYRALCRIIYQERYSNFEDFNMSGKDYYSIRTITILENCKHHPLFKEFVLLVLKLDKYNLSYTQDSLISYIKMLDNGKGSVGVITNQYGDNITGINNFESVKLIKSYVKS